MQFHLEWWVVGPQGPGFACILSDYEMKPAPLFIRSGFGHLFICNLEFEKLTSPTILHLKIN